MLATPAAAPYVQAIRDFLNDPDALTGTVAFADRSGGNLARPYFPDGEVGRPHGPISQPIAEFSPFNNGLQLDFVIGNIGAQKARAVGIHLVLEPLLSSWDPTRISRVGSTF